MSSSVGIRKPRTFRLGAALAVALGAALLTAACSSSSSSSTPAASTPAASTPAAGGSTSAAAAAAGSGSGLVITTKSGSAGAFLTDGSGRAVYLWVKDGKDSSACTGACAGAWPPVTTTGAVTASGGADKADLSTFTRSGGAKQVAYDGHPLYYYVGDTGAGQVNGQGSDGFGAKWWLVDPAGTAVTAAVTVSGATPSAPASSASSGGGGY